MKIRAKGTTVDPVYWEYQRPWPLSGSVEYDVTEEEYAKIKADPKIVLLPLPVLVEELKVAPLVEAALVPDEETPGEIPIKRGPGRPRKGE